MATTNYKYADYESTKDIANKFNTSIFNLVKLNKWLKDPNDGHTYSKPVDSPLYIKPIYNNQGSVYQYETIYDAHQHTEGYKNCFKYRTEYIIVPLIGNGEASIEEYWDNVQSVVGVPYKTLIDNVVNTSNSIINHSDINFKLEINDSADDPDIQKLRERIAYMNSAGLDVDNSEDIAEDSHPIISEDSVRVHGSTSAILNATTNNFIKEFLNQSSADGISDYTSGIIGNMLQAQLNAVASNLNLIGSAGIPMSSNAGYITTQDINKILKDNSTNVTDSEITEQAIAFSMRRSDAWLMLAVNEPVEIKKDGTIKFIGRTDYSLPRYDVVGNPNIIDGQCTIKLDFGSSTKTLYMPCYPLQLSDSTNINFTEENPLGRSEPYQIYVNSGPRSIPFTFEMHREMTGSRAKIEEIVRYIEAASYPRYDSTVAPVKVTVTIGNSIRITGVMKNQSTQWSGPIGSDNKYNMVTVSFTINESTGKSKTANDILKVGGYR